jgi:hypothetical protein
MKLLVPVFGLLALGATARAGSLKAHLECTPDGGTVLKAKQKLALDKDIACSVIVDGGSVPADAKVAIDAKVTTPLGAVKGHPKDASSPDGKTYTADRLRAGGDFLPCGGLQIDAAIVQGAKTLWSGSVRA